MNVERRETVYWLQFPWHKKGNFCQLYFIIKALAHDWMYLILHRMHLSDIRCCRFARVYIVISHDNRQIFFSLAIFFFFFRFASHANLFTWSTSPEFPSSFTHSLILINYVCAMRREFSNRNERRKKNTKRTEQVWMCILSSFPWVKQEEK